MSHSQIFLFRNLLDAQFHISVNVDGYSLCDVGYWYVWNDFRTEIIAKNNPRIVRQIKNTPDPNNFAPDLFILWSISHFWRFSKAYDEFWWFSIGSKWKSNTGVTEVCQPPKCQYQKSALIPRRHGTQCKLWYIDFLEIWTKNQKLFCVETLFLLLYSIVL